MNTLDHISASQKVRADEAEEDAKKWAVYYKNKLKNVLAVAHRDGGQYTEIHGIEKSTDDAIQKIADAIVR